MRLMMVTSLRKKLCVLLSLGLIVRSERDIKNRVGDCRTVYVFGYWFR